MNMKKPRIILFAIILIILVLFSLIYIGLNGALSKRKNYNNLPELSYYHGVIVDENGEVIKTAKVSNINYPKIISTTDDSGNFILEDKSIDVKIPNRIIVKKDFIVDTVDTYVFSDSDYKTSQSYFFCMKKTDTIIFKKDESRIK